LHLNYPEIESMSQTSFSLDWLTQFSDPYAVLGLSVTSDDRRVLKRYRAVAKLLHPDSYTQSAANNRDLAAQLLTRLINPAYQQLKQEKGRADILATLRFRVRRINGDEPLQPQTEVARRLIKTPVPQVDVFYEQAVTRLSESQFLPLTEFESVTQQLTELNLIYLYLKMGELLTEKRTGIISAPTKRPVESTLKNEETKSTAGNYAQRHYQRAQEYGRKENWAQAVSELRDAIRLEPNRGEFHSLLAKAYLMQDLVGMAKVHFRQALKFNPQDPLAVYYAAKLKITVDAPPGRSDGSARSTNGGLFSLFGRKR
jgi:curved DNA-binding protein CbpA